MTVAASLSLSTSVVRARRVGRGAGARRRSGAGRRRPAQQSAHDQLFQLFKDSDEASLKRNPLQALFRGDMRYADRLGDYISDEYYAGRESRGRA